MLPDVSEPIVLTTKPFAGYQDFDDCVARNADKENPQGYCASIMRRVEKARVYVRDASAAPPGTPTHVGPRGGIWFDTAEVPARTGYTPTKLPKQPKGKAPKKPKEEKPPKRQIGEPIRDASDLPLSVQRETADVQEAYTKVFNDVLAKGGSEADAIAAAKKVLPDRSGKEPKETPAPKRQIGSQFQGADDPNLPRTIQQESPQIRAQWVKTFNEVLAKSGSEADAVHTANLTLPLRTNPKSPASRGIQQPRPGKQEPFAKKDTMPEDASIGTRAMICLYPNPIIAEMLAILPTVDSAASGIQIEEAEDLHVTLAYYPSVRPSERDQLIQMAAQIANNFSSPRTEVEGIAQFFAGEDDPIPYVLLCDPRELCGMHDSLCYYGADSPRPAMNHGFIPHMTLAYVPRGMSVQFSPPQVPTLVFDSVSVVFDNEERHDFRFRYDQGLVYRERVEKVDEQPGDGDSSQSSQPEAMTHQGESTTENVKDMAQTATPEPAGTTERFPEKGGRRLRSSWREELRKATSLLGKIVSWADYEDDEAEDGMDDMHDDMDDDMMKKSGVAAIVKSIEANPSFTVFKDANGDNRWLSFSSNGFEDREGEIIASAALEKAVADADVTGKRGELRLFHVKNAPIGDCDFQAIQGRFLVESGTFRDTELAKRALDYFVTTKEQLGVSIGFRHPMDKFDGRVYDEIVEIVERSVCPHVYVANPWTAFTTLSGGEPMDAVKSSWLEKVAGPDLAATIIKQADEATKNLESSVAFKENSELTSALEVVRKSLDGAPQEAKDAFGSLLTSIVSAPEPEKPAEKSAETPASGFDEAAFLSKISEIIAPIAENAAQSAASVASVATEVKTLTEKVASLESAAVAAEKARGNAPRGASMFRASESGPVVDADKAKELVESPEIHTSPVQDYVKDLLSGRGVVSG